MLRPFSPLQAQTSTTMVIVADSPDVILNSKNSKSDGYGGLAAVGLILAAILITMLVFFRNRSSRDADSKQSNDHQQDELGEPDDHDLKMR